jgi:hypothetical protein
MALMKIGNTLEEKGELSEGKGAESELFTHWIQSTIHKIFFFMIPVMAFLIGLFFLRRKELYFVDHAIFALHFHAFFFLIMIIRNFPVFGPDISTWITFSLFLWAIGYFIMACINVYKIGWLKALMLGTIVAFFYALIFFVTLITLVALS